MERQALHRIVPSIDHNPLKHPAQDLSPEFLRRNALPPKTSAADARRKTKRKAQKKARRGNR